MLSQNLFQKLNLLPLGIQAEKKNSQNQNAGSLITLPSPLWVVWKQDSICANAISWASLKSHFVPGSEGFEDWKTLIWGKRCPSGCGRSMMSQYFLNESSGAVPQLHWQGVVCDAEYCSGKTECQLLHIQVWK